MRRASACLSVLLSFPAALGAQDRVVVAQGARVRLTTASTRMVGTVVRRADDSIIILDARSNASHVLPLSSIRMFEISRGKERRTGRGAWIGLVSGTSAGVITGLVLCRLNDCSSSGGDFGGLITLALAGLGAVGGTGIGALIGSQIRTERWDPAPVSGIRVGLMPARPRELRVGVRITW